MPDVYQGTELWEDSLVDPDNRREVDHAHRAELLAGLEASVPAVDATGAAKLLVVSRALRLRREQPQHFVGAGYTPVLAEGRAAAHLVGFLRGDGVVALATRLSRSLPTWADTTVALPDGAWTDRLTGAPHTGTVEVGTVLARLPVALLVRG